MGRRKSYIYPCRECSKEINHSELVEWYSLIMLYAFGIYYLKLDMEKRMYNICAECFCKHLGMKTKTKHKRALMNYIDQKAKMVYRDWFDKYQSAHIKLKDRICMADLEGPFIRKGMLVYNLKKVIIFNKEGDYIDTDLGVPSEIIGSYRDLIEKKMEWDVGDGNYYTGICTIEFSPYKIKD